jgi:transcriptional regulator with XRE-family HTH domain
MGKDTIGTRIKLARERANMTQAQLGAELKLSTRTIVRIETGESGFDVERIEKIASTLNTSTMYLLSETDDPRPSAEKNDSIDQRHMLQSDAVLVPNQILVPVYKNITVCCGLGSDNDTIEGELERYLPLPSELLGVDDEKKVYGMYVEGRSMEAADIPDGSIAVMRIIDDFFYPAWGDPCHVQYERDGFPVDAIKFYYPKRDGSGITLKSADGSGIPPTIFDREDIKRGNPSVSGVVVGVVEFHKPQKGR